MIPIANTEVTLLSGPDWRLGSFAMEAGEPKEAFLPGFDDSDFRTVSVPGEVQLQIGLQGMDLSYQSKELTLVNEKEWWYRKRFVVPGDGAGKHLRLVFDGVDYFATVWLNGVKLGEHEGCYVPFSFDVSERVDCGAENLVAVKVTCPWVPKGRGFLEYLKGEWVYPSSLVIRLPSPPFALGPHWDGIPATGNAALPMGLFRDVKLVASGSVAIDDLFVTTKSINADGSATLGVSANVANHADSDVQAILGLAIAPESFQGEPVVLPRRLVSLSPGVNAFSNEVVIGDPRLWWTWDSGAQNLYRLTATISAPPSAPAGGETRGETGGASGVGGEDGRTAVFGIRTIARKSDMSYWLNGERLFLKGAFYPMSDYYGSRPTRETYVKDLELFKAANLNHLVSFTVVEKPEFYDLCDRLGVLLMVEFPFPQEGPLEVLSYSNPRREVFVKESLGQLRQILLGLRNHPSIILWAAFAEARSRVKGVQWGPPTGEWDTEYGYEEYANLVGKLVQELAPGTIYHPSICDMGERHFWNASGGIPVGRGYQDHFNANARFVSEYGSIAFPAYETLEKILTPQEIWSTGNDELPRWFGLPLDIPAYAYQTSFDYTGLYSLLQRVNQFVDRHVGSIQELIDATQLYQAFLFQYATECYRRRKYNAINGTRIWAYGEVAPGIRFNFLDYCRVPKMGYYFLKRAQERFAISFAYEEALESQVSGTPLRIPVWVISDHRRAVPVEVQCEILTLKGERVERFRFLGVVGSDESREIGVVDWTAPDAPGIYVLRGRALERGQAALTAESSTFIKVTPRLFSRPFTMLLIGQYQHSLPIAKMARAMGISVDVVDESSFGQLADLRNPARIQEKYRVVCLACFDSLWKLLDDHMAEGLKQAVRRGVGFIHTGGPGSFHGGAGRAALLDLRSLAEVLPVRLRNRDDLAYGASYRPAGEIDQQFSPVKDIEVTASAGEGWDGVGLEEFGVAGFNDVDLNPGSRLLMTVAGRPLLVSGRFGEGRTVAFTGFTPHSTEKMWPKPGPESFSSWDDLPISASFRYLVDQEFVADPANRSFFALCMRMIAAASGEKPSTAFDELLAARDKPLFESLKALPTAHLHLPAAIRISAKGRGGTTSGSKAVASFSMTNGDRYARLVRVRAEWKQGDGNPPYLVRYSDNFFDLLPGESKTLLLEMFLAEGHAGESSGSLIVEGPNVERVEIPVEVRG